MVRRLRRLAWAGAAATVAAALVLPAARPARADEESELFARYAEPIDRSINRALDYLARRQDRLGAWHGAKENQDSTAITSLCVMAFLAKGYTPGAGPYGQAINRGIDFILASQHPSGLLVRGYSSNGPMYNHSISTLMLSEVSGMVDPERQEKVDRALARALRVILSAQQVPKEHRHSGGWRYQHTSRDSDMSLTGWAVMALRSARNNGAAVPAEAIDKAVRFILNCRTGDGGFSYQPGGSPGLGRTGTALLCLELTGHHRSRASLAAGDWILRRMPGRWGEGEFFCYALYYAAQATFQLGDRYWERFGTRLYDILLRTQERDGSWPQDGRGGPDYSTAMCVLAMSVSYRQLPIYQR